jgi:hypothetical protein
MCLSKTLIPQCYRPGEIIPQGYVSNSSGDKILDEIVEAEFDKLKQFFKVNVEFNFLYEFNGHNAFYNPTNCGINCNGTIFLGVKMLYSLLNKTDGVERIKAVLAHEFGHCIQDIIYWKEGWKRPELHADFIAGYYTGSNYITNQNYENNQNEKNRLNSFINEFYNIGDFDFFSPNHHGTPEERACSFLEGYYLAKNNKIPVEQANVFGLKYVFADNPCGQRKYYPSYTVIDYPYYDYFPTSLLILGCGVAPVLSFFVLSNEFYIAPAMSFYEGKKYAPKNITAITKTPSNGVVIQLRKNFKNSALEYGLSNFEQKKTILINNTWVNKIEPKFGWHVNYIRNIYIKKLPDRFKFFTGLTIKRIDAFGVGGIVGISFKVFDRIRLDTRYEISTQSNHFQFGLQILYQKQYFWNKKDKIE